LRSNSDPSVLFSLLGLKFLCCVFPALSSASRICFLRFILLRAGAWACSFPLEILFDVIEGIFRFVFGSWVVCVFEFVSKFAEMSLRPNARAEVRKKGYKLAVDAEEARRKREDNLVEIRKNKRDESLLKKRKEGLQSQHFSSSVQVADIEKKQLESVPAMVAGVYSEDPATQLEATTQFRKLLSIGMIDFLALFVW
jgi:hypothetical protein